jgi:CheY-like chemotaxis protein
MAQGSDMTSDHQRPPGNDTAPPAPFIEQVKQALEHLYDFPYLQRLPLAQAAVSSAEHASHTPSQRLQHDLIAAIEALNPGRDVPFRSPHARLYNLLLLHYVEGKTVQEAAHELGVSRRQAHRDLGHGEESVAAVLWARRSPPTVPEQPRAMQLSSVQAEMDRLETRPRLTEVCSLLQQAQQAVERLAQQRAVNLVADLPLRPATISADPVVARQVMINTLSRAIEQAQPGAMQLTLAVSEERVSLTLGYRLLPEAADVPVIDYVIAQLVDRLGWTTQQADQPGRLRSVTLALQAHGPTVLVIDDNAGLVELLKDYLTGHACRVVAATSSREGLRLAQEAAPHAIVLDVMMPEIDGWELLQRLRNHPQTAAIPVIICSVFNNPELAYSLGASLFLPKPVSRDDVLAALQRLGVV